MKKIVSIFFVCLIAMTTMIVSVQSFSALTSSGLFGDANGDSEVDIRDVTYVQAYLAEYYDSTSVDIKMADVNQNGYVDITDASMIQAYVVGKTNEFPTEENTTQPENNTTQPEVTTLATEPATDSNGYYEAILKP